MLNPDLLECGLAVQRLAEPTGLTWQPTARSFGCDSMRLLLYGPLHPERLALLRPEPLQMVEASLSAHLTYASCKQDIRVSHCCSD